MYRLLNEKFEVFPRNANLHSFLNRKARLRKKFNLSIEIFILEGYDKREVLKICDLTLLENLKLVKDKHIDDEETADIMLKLNDTITKDYKLYLDISLNKSPRLVLKRILIFSDTLCKLDVIFDSKSGVYIDTVSVLARMLPHMKELKHITLFENDNITEETIFYFLVEMSTIQISLNLVKPLISMKTSVESLVILNSFLRRKNMFAEGYAEQVRNSYLISRRSQPASRALRRSIFARLYHYSTEDICRGQSVFANNFLDREISSYVTVDSSFDVFEVESLSS